MSIEEVNQLLRDMAVPHMLETAYLRNIWRKPFYGTAFGVRRSR
ncbi:hypothetical protein HOR55_gp25 [Ralstonia phage RS-PII-1]|uniref:Uncharacterized protein n=1 Tax=Ralstonia phage RS-PII-1 TaxID=1932892 RepID=A0A1L7DQM7_9CAUD|nr:hypothetical protein HOR55_gp25 [Ralstonia phage RS-PII-1]APU00312.1 hypothetical protein [Ralstonia phage RS-PII-1]